MCKGVKENRNLIDWKALLRNPNPAAIDFFIENKNNIPKYYELLINNISSVSHNKAITNPAAIEYIKDVLNRYPDNIEWHLLSLNPNAIELLKANPFKIDWYYLSENPNAIDEENRMSEDDYDNLNEYEKINWVMLSKNPNPEALELLIANRDKIHWDFLNANPSIFEAVLE